MWTFRDIPGGAASALAEGTPQVGVEFVPHEGKKKDDGITGGMNTVFYIGMGLSMLAFIGQVYGSVGLATGQKKHNVLVAAALLSFVALVVSCIGLIQEGDYTFLAVYIGLYLITFLPGIYLLLTHRSQKDKDIVLATLM